jgi:thiol-disulfide isomerase/thioredoxin
MVHIVLLDRDHESITIAWASISDAVQQEIQLSEVSSEGAQGEWATLTSTFKAHFLRKKNLHHGVGYIFRLRYLDANGEWSEYSSISDVFFVLPPEFEMMKPPIFASHDGLSITITWDEVENASGYRLRWRTEGDVEWHTVEGVLESTSARKSNLGNGNYYFAVLPITTDDKNWGFSASGGPFKVAALHPVLARYMPSTLLTKKGKISTNTLLAGKIFGIYFSASWCGPCRNFTPKLAKFYEDIIQSSSLYQHKVEMIFCSADNSVEDFQEYYSHMPFAAIPYEDELREPLMSMFQVSGIPRLVIVGTQGQVLEGNAANPSLLTTTNLDIWLEKK